jgi:hypothetical protein
LPSSSKEVLKPTLSNLAPETTVLYNLIKLIASSRASSVLSSKENSESSSEFL